MFGVQRIESMESEDIKQEQLDELQSRRICENLLEKYASNGAPEELRLMSDERFGEISGDDSHKEMRMKSHISNFKSISGHYMINSEKTMEQKEKQLKNNWETNPTLSNYENIRDYYDKLESGINPKIVIGRKGEEFYRTGKIGGDYLSKDYPGNTPFERKQNLQLPPCNTAESVSNVSLNKAQLILESEIKGQPLWAKKSGYLAETKMKQSILLEKKKDASVENRYGEKSRE